MSNINNNIIDGPRLCGLHFYVSDVTKEYEHIADKYLYPVGMTLSDLILELRTIVSMLENEAMSNPNAQVSVERAE